MSSKQEESEIIASAHVGRAPPPRRPYEKEPSAQLFSETLPSTIRRVLSDPNLYKEIEEQARTELEEENADVEALLKERMQDIARKPHRALGTQREMLWAMLAAYLPTDIASLQQMYVRHLEYGLCAGQAPDKRTQFQALALSVRDHLTERWKDTQLYFHNKGVKRCYYMSMEYLMGRSLQNAMINLGLDESYRTALFQLGINLEELFDMESDAGLGNGGLGRLAACYMDSLATQDYPAWGYGIRYTYGMFHQSIQDGYQVEEPDYWLNYGNPWEIERLDVRYNVGFFGHVEEFTVGGETRFQWIPAETVQAVAYDTPIPGFDTYNTLNVRLWSSKPPKEFDLDSFNRGDYFKAIESKQHCENITHVLYPNDNMMVGKELRLKQQYFFVSATLQDIIRRYRRSGKPLSELPSMAAIQLNDTHPSLGIAELMRLLCDQERLSWDEAWEVTTNTFAYTNHTVLPEALEKWSVDLMERLLPRQMRVIFDINLRFLSEVERHWPGDLDRLRRMSIIQEGEHRMVRMAHLAIVGSHTINGVAAIHSQILKDSVFSDFYELWPDKFQNITNGVTPRRWLHQANPRLSALLSEEIGDDRWLLHLADLAQLKELADDKKLQKAWAAVKLHNKRRLAEYVRDNVGITGIDAETMLFDVHVKRLHAYKRQLMNILSVIWRYRWLKNMSADERANVQPRAVFFAGKAAPGYHLAKLIIKLITSVAEVVNRDRDVQKLLKVVFIPNYCVSLAEIIVPASDISQHISTAGTEASGTSNMKFCLNGGLILGTLDGATVEIRQEVGEEQMFIFGAKADEVNDLREKMRRGELTVDPRFNMVLGMIECGTFGDVHIFHDVLESIRNGNDYYLLAHDFPAYLDAHEAIDKVYNDGSWWRRSILSSVLMGKFSSDRSIADYADNVWDVQPCRRSGPLPVDVQKLRDAGLGTSQVIMPSRPHVNISAERFGGAGV